MIQRDRISVEVVGRGPDLVFIPGLASSRETWRATAERLRGRYRLHLVQVSGFAGQPATANASGPVLVPTAEAIDAYLVEQRLTPAVVIGHSLGGTMTLYLAEHHPEHLRKMLIVDSLPFLGVLMGGPAATADSVRPMAEQIRRGMASADPSASAARTRAAIAGMVTAPSDVDRVVGWSNASDRAVTGAAMAEDMTLDLRPGLASIRTPLTLFYPDNAASGAPPGMMERVYAAAFAAVPNKTLLRFDGSKHFIMFDQPAKFAQALEAFLAR